MTFDQFLSKVTQEYFAGQHTLRYGQIFYNVLSDVRPDLADRVNGTQLDPYYWSLPDNLQGYTKLCNQLLEWW